MENRIALDPAALRRAVADAGGWGAVCRAAGRSRSWGAYIEARAEQSARGGPGLTLAPAGRLAAALGVPVEAIEKRREVAA